MLYTEDTYEVEGEPYFGYFRGRYSVQEMQELDAFANSIGMTLIPCIQTLAHLNAALRWGKIPVDCNDVVLTDDERVYEIIDRMFATISKCFTTRKIHIGMDEAHGLGRGQHLDLHGYEPVYDIMKRHLARVTETAKRYGFEVMIWSDMYFRPWNNRFYLIPKTTIPDEVKQAVSKNVTLVYWDYYETEQKAYDDMMENHLQLTDYFWFAGGAWSWYGLVPFNRFTIQAMRNAVNSCRKYGVRDFFMTMWGDDGAECSHFSQLASLYYVAKYAEGITDEAAIRRGFKELIGMEFDDFMLLDCPNDVVPYEGKPRNPSKYMFYADCFNGFLNGTVKEGGSDYFYGCAEKLRAIAKRAGEYAYLFDCEAKLCDFLTVKYELPIKTRRAYGAGDKPELRRLAEEDYAKAIGLADTFADAFQKQWMTDNKPNGFDVQDLRMGGVIRRLQSCREHLLQYVNDELDRIDELEEPLLPFGEEGQSMTLNRALTFSSVNVIGMGW